MTGKILPGQPPLPKPGSIGRWIWLGLMGITLLMLIASAVLYPWAKTRGWSTYTTANSGLVYNDVNVLALDSQNRMWVGTCKGVSVLSPDGSWQTYTQANSGLLYDDVFFLAFDSQSRVWVGSQGCKDDYGGLSVLSPGDNWKTYTTSNSPLANDLVSALAIDSQDRVWVGTQGAGISVHSPDGSWQALALERSGLVDGDISDLAINSQDSVWVGTQEGRISVLSPDNNWNNYTSNLFGLGDNRPHILKLAIDNQDRVWVGTRGGGLKVLSADGSCTTYTTSNSGLMDNRVYALAFDNQDRVWVAGGYGDDNSGLGVLSPDGSWHTYTTANSGLVDHRIWALVIDNQDRVWVGTTTGLSVFDEKSSVPLVFIQTLPILQNISLAAFSLQILILGILFMRSYIQKGKASREIARANQPSSGLSIVDEELASAMRTARMWYLWLWLSPLLTIPTLMAIIFNDPGYRLICPCALHANYVAAEVFTILIAVLVSALWHLVLLIPALNPNRFVRWHGRQALLLAGIRTLIPLLFGLVFLLGETSLLFIPLNFIVWLAGNLLGQRQARRGDCWLARVYGRGSELPGPLEHPKGEDVEVF